MKSKKRIIGIVDDEADISALFHIAIRQNISGYDVFSFNDSASSLKHFIKNQLRYALVITDFRIGDDNGLELLKKVKHTNPRVRTMLISGFDLQDNELYQHFSQLAVIDSTVIKPIRIQRLCEIVESELEIYHSETAR